MKKHSRLVERVVRPYLIFIALILAAAMIVMYFSVVTKLNYEAENAGTKIAETMARQVDTYIEEIDVLAQQVKRQPRIINIFYNLNNTKNDKSNFFNNNVLLGIDVSSILNGLITDRIYRSITDTVILYQIKITSLIKRNFKALWKI